MDEGLSCPDLHVNISVKMLLSRLTMDDRNGPAFFEGEGPKRSQRAVDKLVQREENVGSVVDFFAGLGHGRFLGELSSEPLGLGCGWSARAFAQRLSRLDLDLRCASHRRCPRLVYGVSRLF